MSEREDRVRLQHMLDASRQAIAFIQGRGRKDLDADLQLTLALTRLVEIVGEAAKNVSDLPGLLDDPRERTVLPPRLGVDHALTSTGTTNCADLRASGPPREPAS